MKSGEKEVLVSTLRQSHCCLKDIEQAIIEDKPWEARFLLDLEISILQTIRLHIDTREGS